MKHLILDFDGTMVESGPLIYENLIEYTSNIKQSWDELRDLSSKEVIQVLGISKLDLPKLILKIRADFKLKLLEQPIVIGVKEVLRELSSMGYSLHIVSSNSEDNIATFLRFHELDKTVHYITSSFTIFGKAHGIKKLLGKLKCPLSDAMYIGDETRDIQAAQKVGIKSLAVTWGYNSERVLTAHQPDYIARTPMDLLSILS